MPVENLGNKLKVEKNCKKKSPNWSSGGVAIAFISNSGGFSSSWVAYKSFSAFNFNRARIWKWAEFAFN